MQYMPAKYWVFPSILNNRPSTEALGPPLKPIGNAGEVAAEMNVLLLVGRVLLYPEVGAPFTRAGPSRRAARNTHDVI